MTTYHCPEVFRAYAGVSTDLTNHHVQAVSNDVKKQASILRNHMNELDPHHVQGIDEYTGADYRHINSCLVGGHKMSGDYQRTHDDIMDAFRLSVEAPHDMHLYAGVHPKHIEKWHEQWNDYSTKAYTSTTIHPNVAYGFGADEHGEDDGREDAPVRYHIAHLVIPAKQKGWLYVAPYSQHPYEEEILLPPNTRMEHKTSQQFVGAHIGLRDKIVHIHTFHVKKPE